MILRRERLDGSGLIEMSIDVLSLELNERSARRIESEIVIM